jgi:hypothetical protein
MRVRPEATDEGNHMLKKTRFDGTLLSDIPPFTLLLPYLMPKKTGATIYFEQDVDVTGTLDYMKSLNRELIKKREIVTLFELVMAAAARTLALRPRVNRFISGNRYYQRNQIVFNFVAKKELTDDGQEVNVKIAFEPEDTLVDVARKAKREIRKAVSESGAENEKVVASLMKLPPWILKLAVRAMNWLDEHNLMARSLIESDPMWCSVFLTNVGSFNLDAPYHHLFDRGNCPIFLAVGRVREVRMLDTNGQMETKKMLYLRYSFDDRVAEGVYMAKTLTMLQDFVEHPEKLFAAPVVSPELRKELMLRPPVE